MQLMYTGFGWRDDGLVHSVASARVYSPKTEVRIIGDDECRKHLPPELLEYFVPANPYFERATKFGKVWVHYSPNPIDYELRCLQRWFVVHEYAREQKLDAFWTLDWDVLLFTDLETEDPGVGMTAPLHVFYCRNLGWLDNWLQLIEEAFRKRNRLFHAWKNRFLSGEWPALSDMYLAMEICPALNILFKEEDGTTWDNNVCLAEGFEWENPTGRQEDQRKKLQWFKGYPWCRRTPGQMVRFKGLHCWYFQRGKMADLLQAAQDSR